MRIDCKWQAAYLCSQFQKHFNHYRQMKKNYQEGKKIFGEQISRDEEGKNIFREGKNSLASGSLLGTFFMLFAALTFMTSYSEPDENKLKPINVDYSGYIYVSSAYFTDSYYGNDALLSIHTIDNSYVVTFSDPQWGDVTFTDVTIDKELSGTGKLTMTYRGNTGTYDAVLGGTLEVITITLPDMMGGTTITFREGKAPEDAQTGKGVK